MNNSSKKALILFVIFGLSLTSFAQKGYKQSVGKRTLNFKDSTVFVLEVNRAMEKDVINSWKKAIEKNKIKATIANDQLSVVQVIIKSIDDDPIDIYSTVVQNDKSVKLYSVFVVNGLRVDPRGKEGAAVKVRILLANFGSQVYTEVLNRDLEEKQEVLEDLEKAREKNLKEQDKIDKAIQKDSLKIKSEEIEISLLKGQLEGATERYTAQKNKVASTSFANKEDAKSANAELSGFKKERKSIEKDIEKRHDHILDLKSEIRDYWYKHHLFKKEEEASLQKVNDQRDLVNAAEEDLR
ncbi:MAG: hypothetical protein ACI9GM_001721, partial [Salibacteraceae bacterium]